MSKICLYPMNECNLKLFDKYMNLYVCKGNQECINKNKPVKDNPYKNKEQKVLNL